MHAHASRTGTPDIPAFPAQWFTAYSALSPVSGLFSHRRRRIISANLIPASGDQDHTPLPSASARFVVARQNVHRIPHPTFVTIGRSAPLEGAGCGEIRIFFGKTEDKFLRKKAGLPNLIEMSRKISSYVKPGVWRLRGRCDRDQALR
jgi:hypothetical protein